MADIKKENVNVSERGELKYNYRSETWEFRGKSIEVN